MAAMAVDLAALAAPANTVVLTSECQRGVVGDLSPLPQLAEAAADALGNIGSLVRAARGAGVPVIHCVYLPRADGLGTSRNTPMAQAMAKRRQAGPAVDPAAAAEVVPEVGPSPADIVLSRTHGMSPAHDTGLDPIIRNLGATTVVVTGVSLNIAVPNITMDMVNRGYHVVVPRDAVAGVPASYGQAVLDNTLAILAFLTTTASLVELWS